MTDEWPRVLFGFLHHGCYSQHHPQFPRDASPRQARVGAAKVVVYRLRQRYRDLLRAEVTETVASPGGVEDEIRNLFEALAG